MFLLEEIPNVYSFIHFVQIVSKLGDYRGMWGKMLIDECSVLSIKIVVSSQNYFYQQDTTESLFC